MSLASLVSLVGLGATVIACSAAPQVGWDPEHPSTIELYRRAAPVEARIPGQASTEYRYASSQTPMKLTASDGTGLVLRSLQVKGVIEEPASLTELHLTFENPHDRQLDGQFELLLPRGAELSRFAMKIGGRWIESEVVERQQAREIYADHKHMRQDPALLERERGRRFSGRIFPIAPRERKEIIVSYTNLHSEADARYVVPLMGLPRVDELDVEIVRRRPGQSDQHVELHSEHEMPEADVELDLDGPTSVAMVAGNQALLRVVPIPADAAKAGEGEDEGPTGLSVLIDTSASMAPLARASDEALAALIEALVDRGLGELPIEILAFDQAVTSIYKGPVSAAKGPAIAALETRARLGASDLSRALESVDPSLDRVLLLSDGDISAGAEGRYGLLTRLSAAGEEGLARVDALALGAAVNLEQLEALVSRNGLSPGLVIDTVRAAPSAWVDKLLAPPAPAVSLSIAGAKSVWPERFTGLRPGEAVMVHADFGRKAPSAAKLKMILGEGKTNASTRNETVGLRRGEGPLVARSIAVLRTKALMADIRETRDDGRRRASWRELVDLSKEHRILNDYTSLLVLESQQAYDRFGIERGEVPTLSISEGDPTTLTVESQAVAMDQAQPMPVGNSTTRDFTAVVDLAPTASRDAAGISLAGTSSSADAMSVEVAYGSTGRVRKPKTRKQVRRWKVDPKRTRVGQHPASAPAPVAKFERGLDEVMRRCGQHLIAVEEEWGVPWEMALDLALSFDEQGRAVGVDLRYDGVNDIPVFNDCARYLIDELAGPELDQRKPKSEAALELFWRYDIELPFAKGLPPEDWRIPEVVIYSAEQAYAGADGTTGWARFIAEDLEAGLYEEALDVAWTWHRARPDSPLPYVSLGHALLAAGRVEEAARAYASLIDLHPTRAEARRFAAALLESLDTPDALELAIDSYRKARAIRPDQPVSYHALALALARAGHMQDAVNTLADAIGRTYTQGRFGEAVALMREDLATVAAAAILADPSSRTDVLTQLVETMIVPTATPRDCLRLSWESDASSLALRVADIEGNIYEEQSEAMSVAVNNGYGTQGFEWDTEAIVGPVHALLDANDLGPEGVAMGSVRRLHFDGEALSFETRPFVVWPGQAQVALGRFEPDTTTSAKEVVDPQ